MVQLPLQMIYQTNNIKFTLYGSMHSPEMELTSASFVAPTSTGGTSNSSTLVRRTDPPTPHVCS